MKIVVTATGANLDAGVDPRFGRAAFFLIIDSDSGALLEAIDNTQGRNAAQGAGIGAAAMVADKGVQAVLTGRVGPKAMAVIEKAGLQVFSDVTGVVREAVEKFRSGSLVPDSSSSAPAGGGGGGRCGRGPGGGRGMEGGGRGMGGGGRGMGGGGRR